MALGLLQTGPALAKGRKARVVGGGTAASAETSTERHRSTAAYKGSPMVVREPATNRYITDGGNPAPGRNLVTPMVGQYAISGFEYGVKGSMRVKIVKLRDKFKKGKYDSEIRC